MRMFIHGLKSLVRRPAKTVMLFTILFVVFNLIFIGFIIQNSISKSKEFIRNQIGAAVEYRMDYTAAMGVRNANVPPLSLQVAEKIASNQYVKNYFVSDNANMSSDTISPASTTETSGNFQRNFSQFTFSGSNTADFLDFVMGNVKLVDGKMLSDSNISNGDNVILISEDVAKANNLRIGDAVSLTQARRQAGPNNQQGNQNTSSSTQKPVDYEVGGIYQVVQNDFDVNKIFTSNNVINALNNTTGSDDINASIIYLLDSPSHVEAFKKEASPYLTSPYHTLYSNDDQYNSLTKPLDLISFIASILIWVVFVAGAAIILALVTIFVRDRKFEIGLLLSSGEAKVKIVSQFIFEMLIIAVIAFGVSVASSSLSSKPVGGWIVDNQLMSQSSLIGSTSTTNNNFQMRNRNNVSVYGQVNMKSVADKFDVSLSANVLLKLLLVSIVLVLIGSMIPLAVILGYKPKRILQDY